MSNEQKQNKFESLLELLVNEENEKAEALFHEIVVEKSREIYEGLADEEAPAKVEEKAETKEEDKKEEVKETEKADEKAEDKKEDAKEGEAVKETSTTDAEVKDEAILTKPAAPVATQPAPAVKTDEESIEEIGGDATDQLVKDIASDEEGEADAAADELGQDMDADGDENGEGEVEDRVSDLEDALDELKAEFEAMMNGGDAEAEEQAIAPAIPQEVQPEMARVEGKDADSKEDAKAETKETVKEYKIQKKADTADHSDKSAKSPVASKGGAKIGGTTANIAKGGADETGRAAPTTGDMKSGGFENSPAIDKSKSFSKEAKADTKDGSDKSAKSPISGK